MPDFKILILLVHPRLHKSRLNRALLERVARLECVHIHDLYEHYPDFYIDAEHEVTLLRQAEVIVFQHPFYWYSAPALLKECQDRVLDDGGLRSPEGHLLEGKTLLSVVTTGHSGDSYRHEGRNRFTMRELLTPYELIAHHCGMHYPDPVLIHGSRHLSDADLDAHAEAYAERLQQLCGGEVAHG